MFKRQHSDVHVNNKTEEIGHQKTCKHNCQTGQIVLFSVDFVYVLFSSVDPDSHLTPGATDHQHTIWIQLN